MRRVRPEYNPEALMQDPGARRCVRALRTMYARRGTDAVDALRPFLADTFTFTPAGTDRSVLQETYAGPDGFARFLRRQAELTTDTWWPEVQRLRVGPDEIVADVVARPTRVDGLVAEFHIVHHWRWRGDLITAFFSRTAQQQEYDQFHTKAPTPPRPPDRPS